MATQSRQPLVVAVVLNWNLARETEACVASLLAGDYPSQRVLVVDNGSTDDSVAQLRARFDDRIDLVETGVNLYYAGGSNVGLRWALEAGADYCLVMNNDTVVAPDMVSWLVRTALAYPDAAILGPMICDSHDRSRIWAMGSLRRRWLPMARDLGRGEVDQGQYPTPLVVDYVTGCAMMVRREVLTRVGLFDPGYQMYYEDADLCTRAQAAGFILLVEPRAKMWHLGAASTSLQSATSRYQKTRYRVRFYRQHAHGPLSWVVHPMLWVQESVRAALALKRGERDLARATWRGLRDGYRDKAERSSLAARAHEGADGSGAGSPSHRANHKARQP